MYRSKSNSQVILRPRDLVVLLRLSLEHQAPPTYTALGSELGLTASEAHAGLERAALPCNCSMSFWHHEPQRS